MEITSEDFRYFYLQFSVIFKRLLPEKTRISKLPNEFGIVKKKISMYIGGDDVKIKP